MSRRGFHPIIAMLVRQGSGSNPRPPSSVDISTTPIPEPEWMSVPTRHGDVRCLVYRPHPAGDVMYPLPPVVLHIHGGAFVVRHPEQDHHLAHYIAAEVGAVVVLPDYDTAPQVEYPVAEEQVFDVEQWMRQSGEAMGWDSARLAISGASSGAKFAINVCQQAHAAGLPRPLAAALIVPVTDATRWDRRSKFGNRTAISPLIQKAVVLTYFSDESRRREPLASPRFDTTLADAMPPTLIQTAELDSLGPEGNDLATVLAAGGVDVIAHEFPGVDHGFAATEPVETVREALEEIGAFLSRHLAAG